MLLLASVYDQPTAHQRALCLRVVQCGFTGTPTELLAAVANATQPPAP